MIVANPGYSGQVHQQQQGLASAVITSAKEGYFWLRDYITAVKHGRLHPFTPIERKVREATRDLAWGPTGTLLSELAEATYSHEPCQIIFAVLEFRLRSPSEKWRNVYKALQVLEFLLKRGEPHCIDISKREFLPLLNELEERFEFIGPDGKDYGINVRMRAKAIRAILQDEAGLQMERQRLAAKAKQYRGFSRGELLKGGVGDSTTPGAALPWSGAADAIENSRASEQMESRDGLQAHGGAQPAATDATAARAPGRNAGEMKGVTMEENQKHLKALRALLGRDENRRCADCQGTEAAARSSWASINNGVFICMRCAGIHRGLGVHISKVRSCTLDTWLPEQVAYMAAVGNNRANGHLEARLPPGTRPPRDAVELERFIRRKYSDREWLEGAWPLPAPPVAAAPSATTAAAGAAVVTAAAPSGTASSQQQLATQDGHVGYLAAPKYQPPAQTAPQLQTSNSLLILEEQSPATRQPSAVASSDGFGELVSRRAGPAVPVQPTATQPTVAARSSAAQPVTSQDSGELPLWEVLGPPPMDIMDWIDVQYASVVGPHSAGGPAESGPASPHARHASIDSTSTDAVLITTQDLRMLDLDSYGEPALAAANSHAAAQPLQQAPGPLQGGPQPAAADPFQALASSRIPPSPQQPLITAYTAPAAGMGVQQAAPTQPTSTPYTHPAAAPQGGPPAAPATNSPPPFPAGSVGPVASSPFKPGPNVQRSPISGPTSVTGASVVVTTAFDPFSTQPSPRGVPAPSSAPTSTPTRGPPPPSYAQATAGASPAWAQAPRPAAAAPAPAWQQPPYPTSQPAAQAWAQPMQPTTTLAGIQSPSWPQSTPAFPPQPAAPSVGPSWQQPLGFAAAAPSRLPSGIPQYTSASGAPSWPSAIHGPNTVTGASTIRTHAFDPFESVQPSAWSQFPTQNRAAKPMDPLGPSAQTKPQAYDPLHGLTAPALPAPTPALNFGGPSQTFSDPFARPAATHDMFGATPSAFAQTSLTPAYGAQTHPVAAFPSAGKTQAWVMQPGATSAALAGAGLATSAPARGPPQRVTSLAAMKAGNVPIIPVAPAAVTKPDLDAMILQELGKLGSNRLTTAR